MSAFESPSPEREIGSPALEVDPLIDDPGTRIVVCCGSGGVGKTTTAAALALRAAERGRRVVVLTIDPARRLAQSLGLTELDNTPRPVAGAERAAGGELFAMMLDMKRTFDEIVEAHAPPARARAILENPFYQALSAGFAGTQEYMAMEKLGQLAARAEWDLIVVDTPPSRSALDFLDAPQRLGSFLDGRFIRVLMAPAKAGGRAGRKVMSLGMAGLGLFTGTLGKVLGGALLRDVQTFVAAMDTMFGGFRARADATYRLLQARGTAFLVVAAPERDALREAAYFVERLAADRMPLAGLVLNRVTLPAGWGPGGGGPGTGGQGAGGPGAEGGAARLSAERAVAAAEALEAKNLAPDGIVDHQPGQDGSQTSLPGPGRPSPEAAPRAASADDGVGHGPSDLLAAGLLRVHAELVRRQAREERTRARFTALHPDVPVVEVAALPGDVHDLAALRTVGDLLAGPGQGDGRRPAPPAPSGPQPTSA